jgi:8-oxo-dGTP diphosphatase
MAVDKFNIRVYGIFISEKEEVLVADEERFGMKFTKFPGGGLEFGEGITDCLKRECLEELGQEIEVLGHFYTTDFFQRSAFNESHQLISIYYLIKTVEPFRATTGNGPKANNETFRWIPLDKLNAEDFRFPIDKKVAERLRREFTSQK